MGNDPRRDNARELFDQCRKSVGARESLRAQVDSLADDYGTVSGVRYDREGGAAQASQGDDATERAVSKMEELRSKLNEAEDRYAELLITAQDAIAAMEEDGGCTMGDVETLRYYFLMGWTYKALAKELHYSHEYISDKVELAIIHVSPYVPASW